MTTTLLADFINQCNKSNFTPSDNHIKVFLNKVERADLTNYFIKFVFYYWDRRVSRLNELMEAKLEELENK